MGKKIPKETSKKKKGIEGKDKGCGSSEKKTKQKQTLCLLMSGQRKPAVRLQLMATGPCPACSQREKTENRKQSLPSGTPVEGLHLQASQARQLTHNAWHGMAAVGRKEGDRA